MLPPFEFVDHTADYAMIARGRDIRDLLQNAARGMIRLMADVEDLTPESREQVSVSADTPEQLLVRALKELLLLQEDGIMPVTADVLAATDTSAKLEVGCISLTQATDRIESSVKAVTYHDVNIAEDKNGLTVHIVFDT